jgi:hypothetical protein
MSQAVHPSSSAPTLHGVIAEFEQPEQLLAAARRAHAEGYRRMDAYSPYAIEGLSQALGIRPTRIPLITLVGGILGGAGGYFMMWYSRVISYPLNIGGRANHAWPAFIPITFEMTVLGASLAAFFACLLLNKLPQPYHPVFNAPTFDLASQTRFFLCLEATDPKFDVHQTTAFLKTLNPLSISEVPN